MVERLQHEYLDRFIEETLQAGPTAAERLKGIFKFTARFAVEHTDLVHCLRTLSLELSPSEDEQVEAFFRIVDRQRDFIVSIVSEGQKEGVVREGHQHDDVGGHHIGDPRRNTTPMDCVPPFVERQGPGQGFPTSHTRRNISNRTF